MHHCKKVVCAGSQSGRSGEKTGDEPQNEKQRALKVGLKNHRYYPDNGGTY